ncbi:MAG: tetratricopeptide repeat protein [Candidatus Omnitrophica bacterium]|nr:tetratricopeptide repeat protein [Candidatus Omnitrophota bacterium]
MIKKLTAIFVLFALFLRAGYVFAYTEKECLQLAKLAYENEFYDISLKYLSQFNNLYPQGELKPYGLILQGLNLRKLNKLPEAKKTFSESLADYPESPYVSQTYYLRGETNLSLNIFSEAEADFRNALNAGLAQETMPAAYQGLLTSQANQGKFFEALTILAEWEGRQPELKESSENRKMLINTAERSIAAALNARDFAKVHAISGIMLDRFPSDPSLDRISYYQANALLQEGNIEVARNDFLKLRSSPDPEIPPLASFRLADISLAQKDYAGAVRYYREAEEKSVDPEIKAAAKFQLGTLARKNQDYAGASAYFQKALTDSTQPALQEKALFELAGTSFLSGDYQKAAALYREFRSRFPQNESASIALLQEAFAFYNLKRYAEAQAAFQNLISAVTPYPHNLSGQAQYGLGLVFIALGKESQAVALWERYLTDKPFVSEQAAMVLLLTRSFIKGGRSAEAVPYLRRVTSAVDLEDETRAEAFLLLGLAYLKENKPSESLSALDSGLTLNPSPELRGGLMKNKADLLLAKGDYQQAIPLYQQLRQTLPEKRGEVLYGTAVCLQNLGQTPEAIPVYLEALMNLPANSPLAKEIKTTLAQIKKKM